MPLQENKKNATNTVDDDELVKKLNITDPFIFTSVFSDPKYAQPLLEAFLGIKIDHLEVSAEVQKQVDKKKKSVRFDVYAKDDGRIFDVEMQIRNYSNLALRSRYYISMNDADQVKAGVRYNALPESYVIFFCPFDPLGRGLPMYDLVLCDRNHKNFEIDDRTHRIFYNFKEYLAAAKEKPIQNYLRYFATGEVKDEQTKAVDDQVKQYRKSFRSREGTNVTLGDMLEDAKEEGRAEGEQERQALQDENAQLRARLAKAEAAGFVSDVQAEYNP